MPGHYLAKGLLIGFSIAAPVGPIGLLCLRRSLTEGLAAGLVVGLGAASADALYGAVAAFGLTAISSFLVGQKFWLGLLGGMFLCYLGLRIFLAKPPASPAPVTGGNLISAYFSTFFLTLTNPATILSFVAVFAGFGLGAGANGVAAVALVAGVFAGSALWWLLLSQGAGRLRDRLTAPAMIRINQAAGGVLFLFGVGAIFMALRSSGRFP
ncbi:MAG TPA: LysE family transporter [Verrucomicrobiae bacterium]|jgi:threonine/homoserine/homoserine lactone efflux protein|nr:LysE family transporter [Verrucomicrobiae bacterium]